MANPENLKYTKEHEWILIEDDIATVGITKYAADALGEIVYVDLPKVGSVAAHMKICGEIESTKSVANSTHQWMVRLPGSTVHLTKHPIR
jgi:glycine cleavage system H protein